MMEQWLQNSFKKKKRREREANMSLEILYSAKIAHGGKKAMHKCFNMQKYVVIFFPVAFITETARSIQEVNGWKSVAMTGSGGWV